MMASRLPRRIVCTIVRIDGDSPLAKEFAKSASPRAPRGFESLASDRLARPTNRFASRPSELLPWADPYIAGLVRRLQNDVRRERGEAELPAVVTADLDPPSPLSDFDVDWDAWDAPRWTDSEGTN